MNNAETVPKNTQSPKPTRRSQPHLEVQVDDLKESVLHKPKSPSRFSKVDQKQLYIDELLLDPANFDISFSHLSSAVSCVQKADPRSSSSKSQEQSSDNGGSDSAMASIVFCLTTNILTSLKKQQIKNIKILVVTVVLGLLAMALILFVKYVCMEVRNPHVENCMEHRLHYDGWKFLKQCQKCELGFLLYRNGCVPFLS